MIRLLAAALFDLAGLGPVSRWAFGRCARLTRGPPVHAGGRFLLPARRRAALTISRHDSAVALLDRPRVA
jgi:hypothetical protein